MSKYFNNPILKKENNNNFKYYIGNNIDKSEIEETKLEKGIRVNIDPLLNFKIISK